MSRLHEVFVDHELVSRIQQRLPILFHLAQLEASRGGHLGMEVGSIRERVLVALLMYKFGLKNVDTNLAITEREADVKLFGEPISIKTISNKNATGVKATWTVDAITSKKDVTGYKPYCDILLATIVWDGTGALYNIPLLVQKKVFGRYGISAYLKLPKEGTNPRGVEFTKEAMSELLSDNQTQKIDITWTRPRTQFNPYARWLDLWKKD